MKKIITALGIILFYIASISNATTFVSSDKSIASNDGIVHFTNSVGALVLTVGEPTAVNDSTGTNEDTPVSYNVTTNDVPVFPATLDPTTVDLDPITAGQQTTITTADGTFSVDATGVVTYTPTADFFGITTINYTVNDNGGLTSNAATFSVTVIPINDPPSFVAGPNQSVCENSNTQTVSNWATSMSAGPANESSQTLSFEVTNDNNPLFSLQPYIDITGALTYFPNVSQSGSAIVSVRIKDDGGIANGGIDTSAVQTFTITVNPLPTVTVTPSGATTFCQGGNVMLDAGAGYSTYSWNPGGAATQTISVTSSGDYSVTVTNASSCSATSSDVNVTVNSVPTVTVTAGSTTTFCAGDSVLLDAGAGYSTYSWNPGGATTQTVSVTSSGDYSVTVTNASSCSATSSDVNVTVNALPTVTVTAGSTTTFCAGDSVLLDAGAGYSTYSWNPGGATTQTISITSSGNYSVTVTNASSCSATSSGVNVIVNPLPSVTITPSGVTTFCQGGSVILDAGAGYSTYSWNPGGAATQTISATSSGDYSVTVTNAIGCSATSSDVNVTVNSVPTVTVTAGSTTTFCAGDSVLLDAGAGYSTYSWNPGGASTQTVSVTSSGDYSVTVTDVNSCSVTSSDVNVLVNALPNTSAITGKDSVCENQSGITYSVNNTVGSTYTWTVPAGATIDAGQNTNSISVTFGTTNGDVSVTETNAAGCTGAAQTLSVNVGSFVAASVSIAVTPSNTLCAGSSVTFSATPTNGGTPSYQWMLNGGNVGSNNAVYTTASLSNADQVSCTMTSSLLCATGSPASSNTITVTVNPLPSVTVTPSGVTTFCQGGSVMLDAGAGYNTYSWNPGGAATQTISVTSSGDYSVTVTNASSCSATSSDVNITVSQNPTNANAGSDSVLACGLTSLILYANPPSVGTGTWSVITGTGTFANQNNPQTLVTGISPGANTFRWTISNPPCTSTFDDISITALSCVSPHVSDSTIITPENTSITTCENITDPNIGQIYSATLCGATNGTATAYVSGSQLCVTFTPNDNYFGTGNVCVIICDNENSPQCDTAQITIDITQDPLIVPDGFSPNGDGVNDFFVIPGIENYPNNEITIVNRWGNLIYRASPYNNDWDGTSKHGVVAEHETLPTGTYFMILDLKTEGKNPIKKYIYLNR